MFPEQYYGVMNDVFKEIDAMDRHVLRNCTHCDGTVNQKMAEKLSDDILSIMQNAIPEKDSWIKYKGRDYFIPWEVHDYFRYYFAEFGLNKLRDKNDAKGAIVMNANPFTKGHRHLIEYALTKVDELIVFVVQED